MVSTGKRVLHPLTDQEMAYLAEHLGSSPAVLARHLDLPYHTVHKAVKRFKERGGWACALTWGTCTECGKAMVANLGRTAHVFCERLRIARVARERRRQIPGQSTPYVHRYRQEHPEEAKLLRDREKANRRERWPDQPKEYRDSMLARAHASDHRDYPLTLQAATKSGLGWTEGEDAVVLERMQDPARDVALALGRTLWAVRNRRVRLRRDIENQG